LTAFLDFAPGDSFAIPEPNKEPGNSRIYLFFGGFQTMPHSTIRVVHLLNELYSNIRKELEPTKRLPIIGMLNELHGHVCDEKQFCNRCLEIRLDANFNEEFDLEAEGRDEFERVWVKGE
jgi:hypothetical protein